MVVNGNCEIPNWSFTENQVCKGYVLKAWNYMKSNSESFPSDMSDRDILFMCLRWAFDDMTAQNAYNYYENNF